MTIKTIVCLACLTALASSCTYHMGSISGGTGVVTDSNYQQIDFAYGTARTSHILGIGGNRKDALVLEAKRNLYQNFRPGPGQVMGQTTVDFKKTFIFPVLITQVTLSAEVIDFNGSTQDTTADLAAKKQFTGPGREGYYKFGEEVDYVLRGKTYLATVVGYDREKYVVKYTDGNNNLRIKRVNSGILKPLVPGERVLPASGGDPKALYTPQRPQGELVKFRYKGAEYTGELVKKVGVTFLVRMVKGNGDPVGLYIPKEDIIE